MDSVWQTAEFPREMIPQVQTRQGGHSHEGTGGFCIALSPSSAAPDELECSEWELSTPKMVKLMGQSLWCSVQVAHPPLQAGGAEVRFAAWEQGCQKAPGVGWSWLAKEQPPAWAMELMESNSGVFWGDICAGVAWLSKLKPGFCLSFTQWILSLGCKAWPWQF